LPAIHWQTAARRVHRSHRTVAVGVKQTIPYRNSPHDSVLARLVKLQHDTEQLRQQYELLAKDPGSPEAGVLHGPFAMAGARQAGAVLTIASELEVAFIQYPGTGVPPRRPVGELRPDYLSHQLGW
jgi:hypothetical protein